MMKKVFAFLLVIFIFILSCGCSRNNTDNNTLSDNSVSSYGGNEADVSNIDLNSIRFDTFDTIKYSEDVAWLEFYEKNSDGSSNYNERRYGLVDKTGRMIFYIESSETSDYENGYSHVLSNGGTTISVIDKNGEIHSSYNAVDVSDDGSVKTITGDTSNYCVAYGYGYTVIQEEHSDFDDSYYEYKVYNPDEKLVYSFKTDSKSSIEVKYLGKGVFVFKHKGMFFAKSNKWRKYTSYNKFDNTDLVHYKTVCGEDNAGNATVEIKYLSSKGKIVSTGKISREKYGWDVVASDVYNDISLLRNYNNDNIYLYNVKKKQFTKLTNSRYYNKITKDSDYYIEKDRITITMKGEDEEKYVMIFDGQWNEIVNPIPYNSTLWYDTRRIIVDRNNVYDLDGNFLFSFTERNYKEIFGISNGVFFVENIDADGKDLYSVLDLDGDELYNTKSINLEGCKKVDL